MAAGGYALCSNLSLPVPIWHRHTLGSVKRRCICVARAKLVFNLSPCCSFCYFQVKQYGVMACWKESHNGMRMQSVRSLQGTSRKELISKLSGTQEPMLDLSRSKNECWINSRFTLWPFSAIPTLEHWTNLSLFMNWYLRLRTSLCPKTNKKHSSPRIRSNPSPIKKVNPPKAWYILETVYLDSYQIEQMKFEDDEGINHYWWWKEQIRALLIGSWKTQQTLRRNSDQNSQNLKLRYRIHYFNLHVRVYSYWY